MLKRLLIFIFLLAFFLAGCQSQAASTGTEIAAPETQPLTTQSDQAETALPVPTKTEAPTQEASGETAPLSSCTTVSFIPTPNPTEQSQFPPPGDTDWVDGPETAAMTIYEYSDFQ